MANFGNKALLVPVAYLCATLCFLSAAHGTSHDVSLSPSQAPIAVATGSTSKTILRSEGGDFGLKFRPMGTSFLLAIVYMFYNETAVWSANRNRLVSPNATLFVSTENNLTLRDVDGTVVWSTNVRGASNMTLDTNGNLIIFDGSGRVLWQSFDNPTDTLIPGQIVRAGTFLVSSVSDSNISESAYKAGVLPGGAGFFVNVPEFYPYGILEFNPLRENAREALVSLYNSSCNHTIIDFSDGLKLSWKQEGKITEECRRETGGSTGGFSITLSSNSSEGFRYIRMEPDGNLRLYLQTPSRLLIEKDFFVDFFTDICRLPNYCGPYGICEQPGAQCTCPVSEKYFSRPNQTLAGCKPIKEIKCNSSHTMVELRGVDYFPSRYLAPLNVSLDRCKALCLANCSCVAAFYWQSSGSCFHYEELLSMRASSDQTQLGFLKVEDDSGLSKRKKRFWKQPGNVVGVCLGVALCAVLIYFVIPRPKKGQQNPRSAKPEDDDGFLKSLPVLPPRFTFAELKVITNDFSKKLGSGGFGSVYEGALWDGTLVAVKQLEDTSQGYTEFRTEIATLGSLSHVNLVRLRGFCAEESHHLLVYDYMANRSMDGWLFSKDVNRVLNWATRLGIAVDTARGLAFLHEESRECIVHLDVKPENILLDDEFRAKLSDFGLSKLIDRTQQSRVLTGMRGTPGYLAPEWLMETGVSSKSDIYSFGIVLLEMVSGRRCVDLTAPADECYLPAATIRKFEEGTLMEIVDPYLIEAYGRDGIVEEEVRSVVAVGLWCIQEDPARRPKASTVSRMLEGHMKVEEPPLLSLQSAVARQQRSIWIRVSDETSEISPS
uniref:Receptor-like serine/threonine-protein kinase n=1 Tax=Araucaria cunninghamii TaxID=56994 RepID=A0A0D6R0F5_ARACU